MEAVLAWAGEVGDGLDDMTPEQRKAVLQLVLDDAIIDKHNQVRINLAIPVEVPVSIASASSASAVSNRHKKLRYSWGVGLEAAEGDSAETSR